jgi:hypothetical protein
MPELKLLKIEKGDSQKNFIDKLNYNFPEIIRFGGGPYGIIGPKGKDGYTGETGPRGSYGNQGIRGTTWRIGPNEPTVSSSINGDFWIKTDSNNIVYQFNLGVWSYYGFYLKSVDLFNVFGPISNSMGTTDKYGYLLSSYMPIDHTVVISDSDLVSGTISNLNNIPNPQYSKFVISISGPTGPDPLKNILEFSKFPYSNDSNIYTKNPKFSWDQGLLSDRGKYGLKLDMGDSFKIDIPSGDLNIASSYKAISLKSTGFNVYSTGYFGAFCSGDINFNFGSGIALFSSKNIIYSNKFDLSTSIISTTPSTRNNYPLEVISTNAFSGNIRYYYNLPSNENSILFETKQPGQNSFFRLYGNGNIYMDNIIYNILDPQVITQTVSSVVDSVNINWITVLPSVSTTTNGNCFWVDGGIDYVIEKSGSALAGERGISLWVPATGGTGGYNKGWLNLLEPNESISFTVRSNKTDATGTTGDWFGYIGLNASDNQLDPPNNSLSTNYSYAKLIDENGVHEYASSVDFTIINITGTGGTGGTNRWFKVYYSAWGGNLLYPKCGVLATYNSIS